ncbi:MAG: alginate lyase family protein [Chromatiales bacterium]|nr:alginate lyase family protein [Chromatiales bacterium]
MATTSPDWVSADAPKLWRYNLHYFDYLQWPVVPEATKAALIDDWIARVRPGAVDAWEPYPLSLRIVNWLKYFARLPSVPDHWQVSLDLQVAALAGDIEYHLLANHLFKNGKALVFAGLFGTSEAAAGYLRTGLRIVVNEVREQVLPDGGHFERSPMYHAITLEDLLDLVNVMQAFAAPAEATAVVREAAVRATRFLAAMRSGHAEFPLFNDAAYGIAPPTAALLDYARRVLGDDVARDDTGPRRICFPDTGFYGYCHRGDSLIVDCGPVGPDYQPGHTHCDTLAYELCVDGLPVVVDSGTYDYEGGPFRQYLRSTAAHSTVRVDGADQSEVWGAFRVARRAYPQAAVLSPWQADELHFAGEHDGYRRLPGRPVHRREIRMALAGRWEVTDVVRGEGGRSHRVESFVHLHPDIRVERVGERECRLTLPTGRSLRFATGAAGTLEQATGYHCPQFGIRHECPVLVLQYSGPLPVTLGYVIERV